MKKVGLLVVAVMGTLLMFPLAVWSQCPNLDFSYGNLTYWQCYAGSCAGQNYSVSQSARIPGRIDVMDKAALEKNGQLYDANCNKLKKVPDGYNFSCKVGNASIGAEVDGIEYTMTVDSNNSLLLLSYAWVMQSPGHSLSEQPQFRTILRDSLGRTLDKMPCSYFELPSPTVKILCDNGSFVAIDWKTIGYDLKYLIGQKIKIYFETWDCTQSCHWGYAYVIGECRPMRIDIAYCNGQPSAHLTAPEGFVSYEWTRSSDTTWKAYNRTIDVSSPVSGETLTCKVVNDYNCESELQTVIQTTSITPDFMFGVKDQNGHVDFTNNNQSWYDTCSRTVTFVDMSVVHNGKKDKIKWEISGLNINNGDSIFTYTFPDPMTAPKTYLVRLTVYTEEGCTDTFSRKITIYPTLYPTLKDTAYAYFTTQAKIYCNNTIVSFTNQSYGIASPFFPHLDCRTDTNTYLICEYHWGDGSRTLQKFRNGENPVIEHKYDFWNQEKETTVVVRLVMEIDDLPTAGTFTYMDTLTIIRPMKAGFTSSNHYFPCIGQTGKEIFFTDTSVSFARITNRTWVFGDRHSNPDENIVQGEQMTNPSHIYKKAGLYDVTLAVEDEMGCVDTIRKYNYVFIDGPGGDYKVDTTSLCIPHLVTFTPNIFRDNSSVYGYTADTVIWMPDGVTVDQVKNKAAVALPVRGNYNQAGMYLPVMQMVKWVTDQETGQRERCVVTLQKDTIWAIDLKPDFITESLYGLDEPITFVNATIALPTELKNADSIHWDYGNGNELWLFEEETVSPNGATVYNAEGIYTVTLTEYYKTCSQSISIDIEVVKDLGIEQLRITDCGLRITDYELQITNLELQEISTIEIYNTVGQKLLSFKILPSSEIIINIESLAKGIYFIKINNNKLNKVIKFQK